MYMARVASILGSYMAMRAHISLSVCVYVFPDSASRAHSAKVKGNLQCEALSVFSQPTHFLPIQLQYKFEFRRATL